MVLTEAQLQEIAKRVRAIIRAESKGVGDLPVATSLDGLLSLPALRFNGGVPEVVEAPISKLQDVALDAVSGATKAANEAAAKANTSAGNADKATTAANNAAKSANDAAGSVNEAKTNANNAAGAANKRPMKHLRPNRMQTRQPQRPIMLPKVPMMPPVLPEQLPKRQRKPRNRPTELPPMPQMPPRKRPPR